MNSSTFMGIEHIQKPSALDPRINIIIDYTKVSRKVSDAVDLRVRKELNYGLNVATRVMITRVLVLSGEKGISKIMNIVKKEKIKQIRNV